MTTSLRYKCAHLDGGYTAQEELRYIISQKIEWNNPRD